MGPQRGGIPSRIPDSKDQDVAVGLHPVNHPIGRYQERPVLAAERDVLKSLTDSRMRTQARDSVSDARDEISGNVGATLASP